MKTTFLKLTFGIIFCLTAAAFAQDVPQTAVILEKATVTPTRQLVLWMPSPTKNPRPNPEELYTCPEETRGHYYSGAANVSLVDFRTNRIINTIEIKTDSVDSVNIDLPYWIQRGYYYVPIIDKYKEGKPILMNLNDHNRDGRRHEFVLFDAVACMGLETTLIGYSQKQDRVIQYKIELKTGDRTSESFWADYLFGHKPNKQGIWQYNIDYRGRAGTLDKYTFRYDRAQEKFTGTLISVGEE
jgi:hypothetical protein